eukprot:CAMPEP_0113554036 /NCGR_PEP_ID=MMETSP0015_2-20120614/15931_1 /TAXON_ID=2838 /ORGANISM="Odontella" /LENGTH=151 /DNA_ID=CAMNT_0000455143 /DNA_START=206 /DNA_END=661 /DNA_ORIENTATION=+ /assembly_acc=CAM_ASM_000160
MSTNKTISTPKGINAKMAEVCPELSSSYAYFPLHISSWLGPSRMGPNGEVGFVKEVVRTAPSRPDYVHGTGPNGVGYYHLLTRDSYKILYNRLNNEAPMTGCFCSSAARKKLSDIEDVKKLLYDRFISSAPNEVKEELDSARGTDLSSIAE